MPTTKLWTSVGSAGTVNPPDAGKVVLAGSLVQLGGLGGVINPSPGAAVRRSIGPGQGPESQATIRYNVTAVDGVFNPDMTLGLSVGLGVVFRRGSGQVAARLVQVSIPALEARPNSVMETTLVEFQSEQPNPNAFAWEDSLGSFSGLFDFTANAYYVEVVLTTSGDIVAELPPAVSIVQVIYGTG
jgi:hypothetical protein